MVRHVPETRSAGWRQWALLGSLFTLVAGCGGGGTGSSSRPAGLPIQSGLSVAVSSQTFVDTHHPTAANGTFPGSPTRTLVTTIVTPAAERGPFPLIVFSHGFTATPGDYLPLLREWAAAGYVVAAPAFPLTNGDAPGGPTQNDVVNQPADVSFVISSVLALSANPTSPFHGLVDPSRVGVAGHSAGAITTLGVALDTCCRDARIGAAVIMSVGAVMFPFGTYPAPDRTPALFLHGTADESIRYQTGLTAYHDAHPPKFFLTLDGSTHSGPFAGDLTRADDQVVTNATVDFFNYYLKGSAQGLAGLRRDGNVAGTASLQDVGA